MTKLVLIISILLLGETIRQGKSFLIEPKQRRLYGWKVQVGPTTTTTTNPTHQDWDANQYRSQCSFVYEYGKSLLDLVQLQPGESLLDVGCGTGELTAALAASCCNDNNNKTSNGTIIIMGMDADPNMIQMAQENFPKLNFFKGMQETLLWNHH